MTSTATSSRIPLSEIKIISRSFKSIRNQAGTMEEFPREEIVNYRVPTVSYRRRFVYYGIDMLFIAINTLCYSIYFKFSEPVTFIVAYVFFSLIYYTLLEGLFSSTMGKFFLNVVVIDEYANPIGFKKAFLRAFCRFIPSIPTLFYRKHNRLLHDVWTSTYVINKSDLKHIKEKVDHSIDGVYTYNEF